MLPRVLYVYWGFSQLVVLARAHVCVCVVRVCVYSFPGLGS